MAASQGVDLPALFPESTLDPSLEELCDLNILKRIGAGYAFRTKSFRNLLGTKNEIFDLLVELVSSLTDKKEGGPADE